MVTKVVLPEHALAAVALALEGAANAETAVAVIERICAMVPFDGSSTEPTALLLEAVRELHGTFAVNQVDG